MVKLSSWPLFTPPSKTTPTSPSRHNHTTKIHTILKTTSSPVVETSSRIMLRFILSNIILNQNSLTNNNLSQQNNILSKLHTIQPKHIPTTTKQQKLPINHDEHARKNHPKHHSKHHLKLNMPDHYFPTLIIQKHPDIIENEGLST
jgi:hypothetical protein